MGKHSTERAAQSSALGRRITLGTFERSQRPSGGLEMRKPPPRKVEPVDAPPPSK